MSVRSSACPDVEGNRKICPSRVNVDYFLEDIWVAQNATDYKQSQEGTGVTVQVARQLKVPNMVLIVNKVPAGFDAAGVEARVEQAYNRPVAAVLPHSDELMALANSGIFALRYPDHPVTALYKKTAIRLVE